MELAPGLRSRHVQAGPVRLRVLESGPEDGVPVVLVHGNLSTSRFFEPTMTAAPPHLRVVAPDMRCFGDSDPAPIDATRGLADWADDVAALLAAIGVERPPHLAGWSTGGGAIAAYALARRPVASLTLIDPVGPYGYGGVRPDGSPCTPDFAGSGGGTANPEFVSRLAAKDRTDESPFSPRNVMNGFYWAEGHRESPAREDLLVEEILKTVISEDGYPGDSTTSEHWPGIAPGTRGILNALSPRYCDWSALVDLEPKPPVLWTQGAEDRVISDHSPLELGTLGQAGAIPGWPGEAVFPPQPMVAQIRGVLERYAAAGGVVETELHLGSGHFPPADAAAAWRERFFGWVDACEARPR